MTKVKQRWLVTIVILIVLVIGWFYWFQWRPSQITQQCNEEALKTARQEEDGNQAIKWYDTIYKSCLRKKGLK